MITTICIPTTSKNRDWTEYNETYLYDTLNGFIKTDSLIRFNIGYDEDDPLWSQQYQRLAINAVIPMDITWYPMNYKKGDVVSIWNDLAKQAFTDESEWVYCMGDDIGIPKDIGWLNILKKGLGKNLGIAGGDSGNPALPMTQFLVHKKHQDLFGYIFNPNLENWFCDNYILWLYGGDKKESRNYHYFPTIKLPNIGGEPRYTPNYRDGTVAMALAKRDIKILRKHLQKQNQSN
tara:strand:+ start:339 stop:1040 length:702 start_codon:yes stop_codon:yes gene_type:complete